MNVELPKVVKRISVVADDMDKPMEAWSFGHTWNGFEMPLFERRELEAAMEDGRFGPELGAFIRFLDDDNLVLVTAQADTRAVDGDKLRNDIELCISRLAKSGEKSIEIGMEDTETGICFTADLNEKNMTNTPYGEVAMWGVGEDWTWQLHEHPAPGPKM